MTATPVGVAPVTMVIFGFSSSLRTTTWLADNALSRVTTVTRSANLVRKMHSSPACAVGVRRRRGSVPVPGSHDGVTHRCQV